MPRSSPALVLCSDPCDCLSARTIAPAHRRVAGWLLALFLLLPAACGSRPTPTGPTPIAAATSRPRGSETPAPTTVAPTPTPRPTRTSVPGASPTVIVGGLLPPERVAWDTLGDAQPLAFLLGRRLHRSLLDPLTAQPALAASWTMRGNRATFTLAPGAAWSDGTPLRAADVADLLLQAAEAGDLVGVSAAQVRDTRTLELTLDAPTCPALMRAATWPLVDVAEWPPVRTSGGATVEVQRSEVQVTPSGWTYRAFPDEVALRDAWEAGEVDVVLEGNRLRTGPLPRAVSAPDLPVGPLLATLIFRLDEPLLADARVREALTLATDRAALYEAAYGSPPPALLTALLPPGHWAAPERPLPLDAGRAASRLAQAGWRDGNGDGTRENGAGEPFVLSLTLPLSPDHRWERLGHALAAQWAVLGVELRLAFAEPYALQERLHTARWQVALLTYQVSPDPDQRALWSAPAADDLLGNDLNVTGYREAAVAELLVQAAQVPGCAPADRASFYDEAWAQLLTDRPLWPLFPLPLDAVLRPGVVWEP